MFASPPCVCGAPSPRPLPPPSCGAARSRNDQIAATTAPPAFRCRRPASTEGGVIDMPDNCLDISSPLNCTGRHPPPPRAPSPPRAIARSTGFIPRRRQSSEIARGDKRQHSLSPRLNKDGAVMDRQPAPRRATGQTDACHPVARFNDAPGSLPRAGRQNGPFFPPPPIRQKDGAQLTALRCRGPPKRFCAHCQQFFFWLCRVH